jgi:alpha-beta hydrolase superfamily lysophospholipase
MIEATLPRPDGVEIATYRWMPEGTPRGLVQILHGMAEHARRYDRFARALTAAGWAVVAHDHRGHGRTARDEDVGVFAEQDGWEKVNEDLREVRRVAREDVPAGPLVLFGHSMGSFIAIGDVTRGARPDALVLSGSAYRPPALLRAAAGLARIEALRVGRRSPSRLIQYLSFGSFNRAFEPVRTEFDWLSRDPAEVDAYVDDPRCGFAASTSLWRDLMGNLAVAYSQLDRIDTALPVYVMSGEADPVGEDGAAVKALADQLRRAGVADVTLELYPGARHELLNETHRDEVTAALIGWLDGKLSRAADAA